MCVRKSGLPHCPGKGGPLPQQGHLAHGAGRAGIKFWLCLLLAVTNDLTFQNLSFYKTRDNKNCFHSFIHSLFQKFFDINFGLGSVLVTENTAVNKTDPDSTLILVWDDKS